MITLSWTRRVDATAEEGAPATTREQLWRVLLHKAEHPVDYVPAITECRVLERYPDGFLREARRGPRTIVQRVVPDERAGRITFRHRDNTDLAQITNQIGEDEHGRLTLTLSITLTEEPAACVLRQNAYLHELDTDFAATLEAMTDVLRRQAAAVAEEAAAGGPGGVR
ncbi:AtaL-like protein [Streptomyces gamaensis]|uniref:AtaL-like protein n=1 Tax=Streptomyces gamaensis TaxID=1763542 RepID=A0ABW0YZV7_9ACTN